MTQCEFPQWTPAELYPVTAQAPIKPSSFYSVCTEPSQTHLRNTSKASGHLLQAATLTWFIWAFLALVETPRRPNGAAALFLLGEARQSLATLEQNAEE